MNLKNCFGLLQNVGCMMLCMPKRMLNVDLLFGNDFANERTCECTVACDKRNFDVDLWRSICRTND